MKKKNVSLLTSAVLPATLVMGLVPAKATAGQGHGPVTGLSADSLRLLYPPAFQAISQHTSADSLKAEVTRQLQARYGQHYGCSALSLTAVAATLGTVFSEQQLRSMSDVFSGGIGHEFSQGTCGALTGAIMALGFYASGDKKKHLRLAAEVYEAFKAQEGTVACGDIYGHHRFDRCDGCNRCAVQKVVEILFREGDIKTATINPWQDTTQQTAADAAFPGTTDDSRPACAGPSAP